VTSADTAPPAAPAVTVVGIGADGWDGLPPAAQAELRAAQVLIGGPRQLALLPEQCAGERVDWPSPLRPAVPGVLAAHAGRRIAVLASGDPMFYGIGRTLAETLGERALGEGTPRGETREEAPRGETREEAPRGETREEAPRGETGGGAPGGGALRVLPHPSSISYACARLGWPQEDTEVVTLVGRPLAGLVTALHDGRRVLVLSAGAETPAEVASLLCDQGFGSSRMRVLEQLGGPHESHGPPVAAHNWSAPPGDPLNVIAIECAAGPGARPLPLTAGLPDEAYEHDGQLTKRHVRAATLAALAPEPGQLLWDVGSGSGSVAIEWMRAHRSCRAVAVERDSARAERIARNAERLGTPGLRAITGEAPGALARLPSPDAVFVGGGLTADGLLEVCWDALAEGGRLVANTVTLESEALLARWYRRHGGELVRLAVAHAAPVGGFTGWRQAMPVTQWVVRKGAGARRDVPGPM
jgi:precorrin-6Y C5,15-methyltransferase (decarboxylating)